MNNLNNQDPNRHIPSAVETRSVNKFVKQFRSRHGTTLPILPITSYNQMTARYYSTIGVTPCATIAVYQAIRDLNVDSDSGIWTTASKDLSTPLETTYHPEINYERKLKSKYPMHAADLWGNPWSGAPAIQTQGPQWPTNNN